MPFPDFLKVKPNTAPLLNRQQSLLAIASLFKSSLFTDTLKPQSPAHTCYLCFSATPVILHIKVELHWILLLQSE